MKLKPFRALWRLVAFATALSGVAQEEAAQHLPANRIETPHIAWARPLSGGPLRVVFIVPNWTQREIIESAQRLSLEPVTVLTPNYFSTVPAGSHQGSRLAQRVSAMRQQIAEPCDAIVIGKATWYFPSPSGGIPRDVRADILRKVHDEGVGLVYVDPPKDDEELSVLWERLASEGAAASAAPLQIAASDSRVLDDEAKDVLAEEKPDAIMDEFEGELLRRRQSINTDHYILRGLPGTGMIGVKWADCVQVGSFGKGRVAVIRFPGHDFDRLDKNAAMFLQCLTTEEGYWSCPASYEYLMSFIARAVCWAARRDGDPQIRSVEIPPEWAVGNSAGMARVAVSREAGRRPDLRLRFQVRDLEGETGRVWCESEAAVPGDTLVVELASTLTNLAPRNYMVNLWLMEGDQVLDWSSRPLLVAPARADLPRLTEIVAKTGAAMADAPLEGEVVLSAPANEGESLALRATDYYGRCLWKEEMPAARRTPFKSEAMPIRRSQSLRIEARLCAASGETLDVLEKVLPVSNIRADDGFFFLLWPGAANRGRIFDQAYRVYRDLGVDVRYETAWNPDPDTAMRWNMRTAAIVWRVTGVQNPCLSSERTRSQMTNSFIRAAQRCAPYNPLAFSLGDETWGASGVDDCSCPECLALFRAYLRSAYRGDVRALNDEWRAEYRDFEEVELTTISEAMKNETPARWVDRALFFEWLFADLYRVSAEAIRTHAPGVFVGDEGSGAFRSGDGHDWANLLKYCDIAQSYDDKGILRQMNRSFASRPSLRGIWLGNYSYRRMDWDYMTSAPWRLVFDEMNSVWWFKGFPAWEFSAESALQPDFTPISAFTKVAESVRDLRQGFATLLLDVARRDPDPVQILYSPASLHVGSTRGEGTSMENPVHSIWGRGIGRMTDLFGWHGLSYRFTSPERLAGGGLFADGCRILALPRVYALSDREARSIREFVAGGGIVCADIEPGQTTEHGATRSEPALHDLFSGLTPPASAPHGEGAVLLLGDAILCMNGDYANAANLEKMRALEQQVWDMIEPFGWPQCPVRLKPRPTMVTIFRQADALYVGVDRDAWQGAEPVETELALPKAGHLYDARKGEYLGNLSTAKFQLGLDPALFSVFPQAISGLAIEGAQERYDAGASVDLRCAIDSPFTHVLHVEVLGPDGTECPWFRQNILLENGSANLRLPLARDERPGSYTLSLRDAATGLRTQTVFEVVAGAKADP